MNEATLRARAIERMWSRVDKTSSPTGCWLYGGSKLPAGYGYIGINYKHVYVHRLSYEIAKGPIPVGKQIDHLCRVRDCVNPDHLEAVTIRTNQLRSLSFSGINGRKTHCIRNHEFNDINTHITPQGRRECRPCRQIRKAQRAAA